MSGALNSALTSLQSILSWTPFSADRLAHLCTVQINPPEMLAALSNSPRDFRVNPLCKVISEQSDRWSEEYIGLAPSRVPKPSTESAASESVTEGINADRIGIHNDREDTMDLKTGLLASMCLAGADVSQVRLCADFLAWVWLLDHYLNQGDVEDARNTIEENMRLTENEPGSSEISVPGLAKGLQNLLSRVERCPESGYVYERFRISINSYLKLLLKQLADHCSSDSSQDTKDYLARHREQGWPVSLFILIEYAYGLKTLSEEAQRYSALTKVRNAAAEIIIYALDIYTCAGFLKQHSSHDLPRHNIVTIIAQERKLHILPALGRAKELCSNQLRLFSALQESLLRESPSPRTARGNSVMDITTYMNALGDCIRGIVYWACEGEKFFGKDGLYSTLVIEPSDGGTNVQGVLAEE